MSDASLQHAAELIARHIPCGQRGPIWERVRKVAESNPITIALLRHAERLERIDRWRSETRARYEHRRVSFVSLDDAKLSTPPSVRSLPENFIEILLRGLNSRECLVVHMVVLRENTAYGTSICLGVTEARVSQMLTRAIIKLRRNLAERMPELVR